MSSANAAPTYTSDAPPAVTGRECPASQVSLATVAFGWRRASLSLVLHATDSSPSCRDVPRDARRKVDGWDLVAGGIVFGDASRALPTRPSEFLQLLEWDRNE